MDIASPAFQLEEIERASAAFEAAIDGDLGTDIEFIEGWSVRDLVAHLGAVYAMAAANVRAATEERTAPGDEAQAPEGEAIAAWFGERRTDLLQALNDAPVDRVAASHAGVQTAGWWRRRLMHETVVHLWDLQTTTGEPDPIDGDLATDGIDEYTEVSLRVSGRRPNRTYPAESLHLHRTDGDGEWMFVRGATEHDVVVTQEHGKGDAAVRGPGAQLLLWIWGRPATDLEFFGDAGVAEAWRSLAP